MEKHKELQLPVETLKSDFLRSFLHNLGSELAPREQPIQNLLLFDGDESRGPVYALHPIFGDGLEAVMPVEPVVPMVPMVGAVNGGPVVALD
ncbi:E1 ubiquitin-activating protein aos1 [Coniosporium tulheliwenetii]|uniref:E1 ubiquitin-activating protein aos1 n=1 Tax=Coniosporium tulheliwenetii TaxID=3383036 RepID=A0ACC2Z6E1_9PEZI|nr:E1 ubiquitin-activating protein aos1 [Cladosporium sp. JES 115]